MKYETQRVAYPFFAVAMALFALQIMFGIMTATVYDPDMATALNEDEACGYDDWEVGVTKSLLGTDCTASVKDIIYIDDTGEYDIWYKGCDDDECVQDAQGYPAEIQHDQAKHR